MKQVSNTDFDMAVRLLAAFSATKGNNLREQNDRRQASRLVKKWRRLNEKDRHA